MANIKVLDQNTINQIAAGEVIERPASVVKELLENAIDAKATAVTVETKDGGLSLIRVTDNGCGIPKEELSLAFLRHATSKIQTALDLFTVASLGFRGEALASIASVSQVELITKVTGSMSGSRYQIEGGEEKALEEVGAPEGTTFISRNLFYNTPARRKFLKTPATEGAHVADLVERIALSHPEISIRLIQNNQNRLHTSGNHNLKDIIYTIYGREIASNLLPVQMSQEPIQITGFIGKPLIARGNRNYENYFINGRYIRSSLIGKAIEDAYKPFMMQHKYPFTMLQFTIDPSMIDVNVHPAKMELRFTDGEMIYKTVFHTVSMALSHKELIPEATLSGPPGSGLPASGLSGAPSPVPTGAGRPQTGHSLKPVLPGSRPEPFEKKRMAAESESGQNPQAGLQEFDKLLAVQTGRTEDDKLPLPPDRSDRPGGLLANAASAAALEASTIRETAADYSAASEAKALSRQDAVREEKPAAEQLDLFEEKLLTKPARSEHKLLGQLFDTYWLVQFKDHLYIIDQHAAHEKVLYEKTMVSLKNREYASQLLNPPIILTLNSTEEVLLLKYLDHFHAVGFEIEPFGGKEYAVRSVPANLFSIAQKDLLMEMLDSLSDGVSRGTPDTINEKIASMSCKAAVKGNHSMSAAEADQLIDQLLELENPYACPHGRPTIISMSKRELERKFKRIV